MAIGDTLDRLTSFELAGIPVGAGIYYKAAEQVAAFLGGLIQHFVPVPPIVSDFGAAYLLKLPMVQDFLGKYGSQYASMAAVGGGIDKQFNISGEVAKLLGNAEAAITGGVSGAQAAIPSSSASASAAAPTSGFGAIDAGDLSDALTSYTDQYKKEA